MTVAQNDATDAFLEHYGVKGMHWGARKAVIKTARQNLGQKQLDTKKAERSYLRAKTGDEKKRTLKELQGKERDEWENKQIAATLTRGEQFVLGLTTGVLLTPVGGIAALAATSALSRDSKQFTSQYPDRLKGR